MSNQLKNRWLAICVIPLLFALAAYAGVYLADFMSPYDHSLPMGLVTLGPSVHNFGLQKQQETLSHSFTLFNNTGHTLEISEIVTSCKCMVAESTKAGSIPPRSTLVLPVSITTSAEIEEAIGNAVVRYTGKSAQGDEVRGQCAVQLRAKIEPEFTIIPPRLDFGSVDSVRTRQHSKAISIVPANAADVRVTGVRTTLPFVKADVTAKEKGSTETVISVTVDTSHFLSSRDFSGAVIIETNCKRSPVVSVEVVGKHKAITEVHPEAVVISSAVEGDAVMAVQLRTFEPSLVKSVDIKGSNAKAHYQANSMSTNHEIVFTISDDANKLLETTASVHLGFSAKNAPAQLDLESQVVTIPITRFPRRTKRGDE